MTNSMLEAGNKGLQKQRNCSCNSYFVAQNDRQKIFTYCGNWQISLKRNGYNSKIKAKLWLVSTFVVKIYSIERGENINHSQSSLYFLFTTKNSKHFHL